MKYMNCIKIHLKTHYNINTISTNKGNNTDN